MGTRTKRGTNELSFDDAPGKTAKRLIYRYITLGREGSGVRAYVYGHLTTFDVGWLSGKGKGLESEQ